MKNQAFVFENKISNIRVSENKKKNLNLITITGPTGSGKTNIAIEIAKLIQGEIINADKTYFFQGMEIGTGANDILNQGVNLHLYGILRPDQANPETQLYISYVKKAYQDIYLRRKFPIIEGNTPRYLNEILFRRDFGNNLSIALELPEKYNLEIAVKNVLKKLFHQVLFMKPKKLLEKVIGKVIS